MPNTYMNREDVGDLYKAQTFKFYLTKILTTDVGQTQLQSLINDFLVQLPVAALPDYAHVVSVQYHTSPAQGNDTDYTALLTLYFVGTAGPNVTRAIVDAL